jgi:hypothetical protein
MTETTTAPARPTIGQMARFTLNNGMLLEIHISEAASVTTADSPSRTPGFILRDGKEIVNVGPLSHLFPAPR